MSGLAGLVARRAAAAVATILVALLLFQAALALVPGDPIRALFGPARPAPEVVQRLRQQYHLDDPFLVQYVHHVADLVRGDWGRSYPSRGRGPVPLGPPVRDLVAGTWTVTARLLGFAMLVQVLVGVGWGVVATIGRGDAARRRRRRAGAGAVLAVSVPVIVAAFVLQGLLTGPGSPFPRTGAYRGWLSWVLPVTALALASTGTVALLARSTLDEVLHERWIAAARSRALSETRVVAIHALRVAAVPVAAFAAANLGQLLAGVVIVEGVFQLPGTGALLLRALQNLDGAIVLAVLSLATVLVVAANLVADILVAVADPRTRR